MAALTVVTDQDHSQEQGRVRDMGPDTERDTDRDTDRGKRGDGLRVP